MNIMIVQEVISPAIARDAVRRILSVSTGIVDVLVEQVTDEGRVGKVERDPVIVIELESSIREGTIPNEYVITASGERSRHEGRVAAG